MSYLRVVRRLALVITAIVAVLILLSRCTPDATAARKASPKSAAAVTTSGAVASTLPPLRILAFVDQTRSMDAARVSPVNAASFTPIYDRLLLSGGELAVGRIRDNSDRPFARLYIPVPPTPPQLRPQPTNVFEKAARKKQEDAERTRYDTSWRAWRTDASARIAVFSRAIEPFVSRPADAPATDVWQAVRRAAIFFGEPNGFPPQTRNVVVFVSDGVETARIAEPPASFPAQVLLVNGAGDVGDLGPLAPVRFESLDAALRYAVTEGGADVRR